MAQLKDNSRVYGNLTVDNKLSVGFVTVGDNLSVVGITTLDNIRIDSGIISATSGIITYYGDGSQLQDIIAIAEPNGTNGEVQFNDNGALDGAEYFFYDKNSIRVGIGTSVPTARLSIANTSTGDSLLQVTDNVTDGSQFRVNDSIGGFIVDVDVSKKVLFNTTALGIGTLNGSAVPNPQATLHVDGTSKFDGNASITGDLSITNNLNVSGIISASQLSAPLDSAEISIPGVTGEVQYKNSSGLLDGASYFFYDSSNIRVGIGTSLPSARLNIANVSNGDSLLAVTDNVTEGSQFRVNNSFGSPIFDVDADGTIRMLTSGNVGIGSTTTFPSSKLDVDGDIRLNRNGGFIFLRSPNGTSYKLSVDNSGNLSIVPE